MAEGEELVISGPIGPETLRLPGAPQRLKQAVQGLAEMVARLDRTSQELLGGPAAGQSGAAGGKVAQAMAQVAHRTGQVLAHDADALRDLSGALDHEADVLRDAQSGTMPELRSRWHAARADLAEAVAAEQSAAAREGAAGRVAAGSGAVEPDSGQAGGHVDAAALARHLDESVVGDYEHLFRTWLGLAAAGGGGGGQAFAVAEGGPLQEGSQRYRQTVRAVLEDYRDAVLRVQGADQHVAEKLPRHDRAAVSSGSGAGSGAGAGAAQPVGGAGDTAVAGASTSPADVRRLGAELADGVGALRDLTHSLEAVRQAFLAGRMVPAGERVGSSDGFQRDWAAHFEDLTSTIDQVRHAADSVAQRLEQLEEEAARDIRHAGRADH